MTEVAIEAVDLTVRYGAVTALDEVSLSVRAGEVVALLGPNGAGKTTAVETLLGYRSPAAGRARVLGCDPVADHGRLVRRIGAMPQSGGVWPSMAPREALALFASYYPTTEEPSSLLELLDLGSCARTPWRRLSGGEQQRVSLAIALLPRPDALFLDEPTAGVDPVGRQVIREVVRAARARGAAVLLTTHDLHDVEAVCDAAVIVHHGRVRAEGEVATLTAGGTEFASRAGLDTRALAGAVGTAVVEGPPGTYRTEAALDAAATASLAAHLSAVGAPLASLRQGRSLEARYVELVGDAAHEPEARSAGSSSRRRR